jgi:hypothetical protein
MRVHFRDFAVTAQARARAFYRGETTDTVSRQGAPGVAPECNERAEVLRLQRTVGNAVVSNLVHSAVAQRAKAKKKVRAAPPDSRVEFVKRQVAAGRFADLETPVPDGAAGPPSPGGAFWLLNGLNPADMQSVLTACGKGVRTQLLTHIGETEGRFDRPRLEAALRATSSNEPTAAVSGLELLDAVREAKTGSFAGVWLKLAGQSRPKAIATLRVLPRPVLTQLQSRLAEAPAADNQKLTEVIADLLGAGTNMQAVDVIDLEGLSSLERVMASIYNIRGQLIMQLASGLGVATHAAAGIMKAESGGATFSEQTDKAIVRFENHVFWDRWGKSNKGVYDLHFDFDRSKGGKRFTDHLFRETATGQWNNCHQNQTQEWNVMEFAASLSSKEEAYGSASWGAGQIMGFNSASVGFATATELAEAYNRSERSQVTGIFEFIRAHGLVSAVQAADYIAVAKKYNGKGQAAVYGANIKAAAEAYQRVTKGRRNVIP